MRRADKEVSHRADIEVREKFRRLELASRTQEKVIDFYSAAETQWSHVIADLDATLPDLSSNLGWLSERAGDSRVCLVIGGPVSGKTAFALRLAHDLAVKGYKVWNFRNEEQFEQELLLDYLSTAGLAVLVFDDCADFSGAISSLLSEAVRRKLQLRIVATADKKRHRGVQMDLSPGHLHLVAMEPLRKDAFQAVFDKRKQKGRLGRCTGVADVVAWTEFKETFNMKLLEWMESLEGALPFQQAIARVLDDGMDQSVHVRQLVLATAATHRFGFSLPFEYADTIRGTLGLEELVEPQSQLNDIAYLDDKGIRLRSRSFSMHTWQKATGKEKFDITLFLAKQLAPLLVPQSIARRSYPYRILRE